MRASQKKKIKIENFYNNYSTGANNLSSEKNFFSEKNIKIFSKEIFKNCKRLNLDANKILNKNIMNVGSGREALGFLQFRPKTIDYFDISEKSISNFKKFLKTKTNINIINSNKLDLCKDRLPKNKYDLIYLHGIIQHVDHVGKALKNISDSLKKNGIVWFYFYRPGSLANFLGSLQRYLLKNTDIDYFYKKLKKQKFNYKFVDALMDDCFVPNRQLFYPKDYLSILKKLNLKMFGSSLLVNSSEKYNFNKFHTSVIFFLKKNSIKKSKISSSNFLKPQDQINDLNIKYYKKNKKVLKILKTLLNKNLNKNDVFNQIILIEKLKVKIKKNFFIKKKL